MQTHLDCGFLYAKCESVDSLTFFSSLRSLLADSNWRWEEWMFVRPFRLAKQYIQADNMSHKLLIMTKETSPMGHPIFIFHIYPMHHTLISIFWWIQIDYVVRHFICCIFKNNDMIKFKWQSCAYDRIDYYYYSLVASPLIYLLWREKKTLKRLFNLKRTWH